MTLKASDVTGIIVTRGDVDCGPCLETWPAFGREFVWNNASGLPDVACFGRWLASSEARTPVVFHQDDDVIVPTSTIQALLEEWQPEDVMVCNMDANWIRDDQDPEFAYHDLGLVGAGSLALRDCWEPAVINYLSLFPEDRFFHEWADFVVGTGTPHRKVEHPVQHRDIVRDPNRLANIPGNRARRKAMMRRARNVHHWSNKDVNRPSN